MKTKRNIRFLSMLLALLMLVSLMPMTAFADDGDTPPQEEEPEITELRIVEQPTDVTVAYGEEATFTVVAEGDELSYQWFFRKSNRDEWSASKREGAQTASYSIPMTDDRNGQSYRCRVTDSHGAEVFSDYVYMNAIAPSPAVRITEQPVGAVAPEGEIVFLDVRAEGTGLRYQWQYRSPGSSKWYRSGMEGADTDMLEIPITKARNGQAYRCVVTDISGARAISDAVTVHIEGGVNILEHPRDASGMEGDIVILSVIAEGDSLSYQWQYREPGSTKWLESTEDGAQTDTTVVPIISQRDGYQYRCVVTDCNGSVEYSTAATLTLRPIDLTIVKQPENVTVNLGETAVFSVEAEGSIVNYQWQYTRPGLSKWYDSGMCGFDSPEIQVPTIMTRTNQQYRCVITDASGARAISDAATLTVIYQPIA